MRGSGSFDVLPAVRGENRIKRPETEIVMDIKFAALKLASPGIDQTRKNEILGEIFNAIFPLDPNQRLKLALIAAGWIMSQDAEKIAVAIEIDNKRYNVMVDLTTNDVGIRHVSTGEASVQIDSDWRKQNNPYLAFARFQLQNDDDPAWETQQENVMVKGEGCQREIFAVPVRTMGIPEDQLKAVFVVVSGSGKKINSEAISNLKRFIEGFQEGDKPFSGIKTFF